MNNKVDFFQKKFSNTRAFSRQKEKSRVWTWVIVIIILLVLGLVCWKLFWAPTNLKGYELEDNRNIDLSLGEQVFLQGEIKSDGDIITHTHTINDVNYGVIGIKSDLINLSDYVGFVELTGMVEKFYQGDPIVKVITLSGSLAGDKDYDTNIVLDGNSGVYLLGAGIQFLPSFFDEYVLLNEGDNGEIRIQNIESGEEIKLSYFRCNASDPNRNCKGLSETFANNNAQSFVTSEGDVYYKLSETQSWFVANGDWRGVFINDVSDDVVFKLKDLIKFANQKNMNEWIKSRAMKICQGEGEKLQKINNSEINLKQEGLIVTVSGDGNEKQMTCQILVDFSLPTKGKLQSLTIGEDVVISDETEEEKAKEVVQEEKKDESQMSVTEFDTNVPQFQLKNECVDNPGKEGCVKYESVRGGYILNFPSPSISFVVSPIKENFGRNDVNCSYVINVIKITEKENLEISPAIRVYECDGSVNESWTQEVVVYSTLGRKFVVQMNDGAWKDFSTHLNFEELVTE